jgi:hypothetical protein
VFVKTNLLLIITGRLLVADFFGGARRTRLNRSFQEKNQRGGEDVTETITSAGECWKDGADTTANTSKAYADTAFVNTPKAVTAP